MAIVKANAYVDAPDQRKLKPLHLAVAKHQYHSIFTLLASSARVNLPTIEGDTALHMAVSRCDPSLVEPFAPFLSAEADVTDADGLSPLNIAASMGNQAIFDTLL